MLCSKLKRLKADIKVWNVQCFGNIFNNVKRAENEVVLAEKQVEDDISVSAQESLRRASEVSSEFDSGRKLLEAKSKGPLVRFRR